MYNFIGFVGEVVDYIQQNKYDFLGRNAILALWSGIWNINMLSYKW